MTNIKQVEDNDLESVLSLQKAAFMEVAKQMNKYDIPPLLQTIQDLQNDFKSCTILKYTSVDNQIIGSVRGCVYDGNVCHVGKLIVHPAFQNQGIGKALLYELERCFSTCHKYTLFTSEDTPNSLSLYSKIGYHVINKKEMNGIEFVYMEKENHG